MIEQFSNQYSISKTLRFKLIPVGKTEKNFDEKLMLEQDKKRAESYKKVKVYMDRYHKFFIESVLSTFILEGVKEYSELYYKTGKTDKDIVEMKKSESKMRKDISSVFAKDSRYKLLNKKEFVRELLPDFLSEDEEKNTVAEFNDFTTYFTGFWQNRENMYSAEEQSTAIGYRCINDNLPKFLDNVKSFSKVISSFSDEVVLKLNKEFSGICRTNVEDIFTVEYFSFVLAQSGIDRYNEIIGGYTTTDGTKIQGINEYINLYNQQIAKNDKSKRLPLLKPLFKQILSDRDSISFIPESYADDNELLVSIKEFFGEEDSEESFSCSLKKIKELFNTLTTFDFNGIHITNDLGLTNISNKLFNSWNVISDNWNKNYESTHSIKKGKEEAFYEEEKKAFKRIGSFSVNDIASLGNKDVADVSSFFTDCVNELYSRIIEAYNAIETLVSNPYMRSKRLSSNDNDIQKIKTFLDSVKELEKSLKPLCGTGKEEEKDNEFYGKFLPLYDSIRVIDTLYNKVRNYLTQKPYSTDKIKLNFENPQFLGGWDKNKERDYRSVILRKNGKYYLAVMDKSNNKVFANSPDIAINEECYEKMEYKLLPDPSKMLPKVFFAKSNIDIFQPSDEIVAIREKGSFKKGSSFKLEDCRNFIDFYKESIAKHEDWSKFGFSFSDTTAYSDISGFFREVADQGYSVKFSFLSEEYINEMIDNGSLYLFQIYNKDFSDYSKGTPNLHTLYFKMLFDERNLQNVVYKLNGQSEMFYREASIKDSEKIIHPANQPINNKNSDNAKKQSKFEYDLIKDKRYTRHQFALHIPITMNFKASGTEFLNNAVREAIRKEKETYVIGIDRGERNLIYITVIDSVGNIVEQKSLNEIVGDNGHKVNYHTLLDRCKSYMDKARKDWKKIGNIKELKEGYLSQVIHEICKLVVKYDAIIVMEDLNTGFMNSRIKIEKQVYQKFEKMLTDKLNYFVDKKKDADEIGGLLHAYQLTNKASKSRNGSYQNGIIFYIPAWLTSKIDPTTGFANLLNTKYTSVTSSQAFFGSFDDISYNELTDMFEFKFDYDNFPRCQADYQKKWTVCTNGERIRTFCNKNKNNERDNEAVMLTEEFKYLFKKYGINYKSNLKSQIIMQNEKQFFEDLLRLLSLTLQMRNSITGNVDVDYLISPVRNSDGNFYDSRNYETIDNPSLPINADSNGAYNIARKGLWAIERIREAEDITKVRLSISNREWLEFAQNNE